MLRRSANVWYLGAASVRLVARTTAVDVEVFDFRDYASMQLRAGGFGEGGVVGGGLGTGDGGRGTGDGGFVEMRWGSGFYGCLVDWKWLVDIEKVGILLLEKWRESSMVERMKSCNLL